MQVRIVLARGKRTPVLVIHGGTGARPERTRCARIRQSLRTIAEDASAYLSHRSALETVVYAVQQLEDDPLFNAGTGSALQRDGRARMSASVMDGATRRFAAVVNVERVRHPILVAATLLAAPDRILAGEAARRFARSLGMRAWNPITAERLAQWRQRLREAHGTVGAIALDRSGRLAAATSTGGRGFERPGRVSDSGLPAGTYATDRAAVSCTGLGEEIVDEAVAARFVQRVTDEPSWTRAVRRMARELTQRNRRVGFIALDHSGALAWATTLPALFAVACTSTRYLESF